MTQVTSPSSIFKADSLETTLRVALFGTFQVAAESRSAALADASIGMKKGSLAPFFQQV